MRLAVLTLALSAAACSSASFEVSDYATPGDSAPEAREDGVLPDSADGGADDGAIRESGGDSACSRLDKAAACAARECGPASDGCGGLYDCGSCSSPDFCGGGGTPGRCGCVPKSQSAACAGAECGPVSDGCGKSYQCTTATCPSPLSCGGGGVPGKCGCLTRTKAEACGTQDCGWEDGGCGSVISCGTCPSGKKCGPGSMCIPA